MWNIVKYVNGEEVEDYGVIQAASIRQLVKIIENRFGLKGLKYEKWDQMKSPVYNIYLDKNDATWFVASKYN